MVTNDCVHQFDNGFAAGLPHDASDLVILDTKVQTEHIAFDEAGTVRPSY